MGNDPDPSTVDKRSGGVDLNAGGDNNIGGDVVGRDKIMQAGDDIVLGDQITAETYVEHATVIEDKTNRVALVAIAGVVGLIVVILGILIIRSATAPASVVNVILPTNPPPPTNLPAPTNLPPATLAPPTVMPTVTPIFNSNARYRVAIAKMNDQNATKKYAIEPRLESDLRQALRDAGLAQDVDVRVVSQPPIDSESAAQDFAASTQSDIVVWGIYDDLGIRLSVLLGSQKVPAGAAGTVFSTSDLPLANSSAPSSTETISFYITGTLPADAKFLSFYVIGHLDYLANRYDDGHRAFDAATKELPNTVRIADEALLHFFQARALPSDTLTNTETIACEYAKAIELDPTMFEAYNNLGVWLRTGNVYMSDGYLSPKVFACFAATDLVPAQASAQSYQASATDFFSQALKIKPDLGVALANLAILEWNKHIAAFSSDDPSQFSLWSQTVFAQRAQARQEFEAALKTDPTLGVAHVALGNMAVWDGDYLKATDQFSAALKLNPKSPEVMLNLGQALQLAGRSAEAESEFQRAIQIDPKNIPAQFDAQLALGDLYSQQGMPDRADAEFVEAHAIHCGEYCNLILGSYRALGWGRVANDIRAERWISASQHLDQVLFDPVSGFTTNITDAWSVNPLAWLVGRNTGVSLSPTFTVTADITDSAFWSWTQSDLAALINHDLVTDCQGLAASPGSCVYDQSTLLTTLLPAISARIHQRLFYNNSPFETLGMACPYVYTFDPQQNHWQFDTTILYKLVGPQAKATQARRLARFDGRLLIREVEPEVSYIDSLEVRLIAADGREIILKPDSVLLSAIDQRYLVLQQGDQQVLTFNVPEGILPAREAAVIATGYYVPLQR
ncbi:MAG TPA: tetratricopeptide repeat protein [Anaerolineae bacterium]|nr:tetratricopeptide repeat protein [Anaerolineae bacterium]